MQVSGKDAQYFSFNPSNPTAEIGKLTEFAIAPSYDLTPGEY